MLPSNLEKLDIFWPRLENLDRLHDVTKSPKDWPHLATIDLYARSCVGNGYKAFNYLYHPVSDELWDMGIDHAVHWHVEDFEDDWMDDDYDPFICDIVLGLEELKGTTV
jgi:hypothetical protein